MKNFNARSVDPSHFAMVPRSDVPRSVFHTSHAHKTTFNAGMLIPVYVDEVLPGDHFRVDMTAFVRMATLIFPLMDNLRLTSWFFFVPNRLVWSNWQKFMGERTPYTTSSIDYVVPVLAPLSGAGGFVLGSMFDYMGLPSGPTVTAALSGINSLPFRGYNLIWNEWFRDQNLQDTVYQESGDGPDAHSYALLPRNKCHDYFTSALPWAQKGDPVTIPLGTTAPIAGLGWSGGIPQTGPATVYDTAGGGVAQSYGYYVHSDPAALGTDSLFVKTTATGTPQVFADLSQATAATINVLRQAFQVQKLLERDARGGTRYTEILRAHFGVISPDARLQRPEYLGGGVSNININPVAQTASTDDVTPQGNLAGVGTGVARHGFSKAFVEHGYVFGLVCVDADVTYQQGLNRMWSRSTRYDFYWPEFAHLGEQAVLRKEIYCTGVADDTQDDAVFGYQERYGEYRYRPSMITGMFRSGITGTLDAWHLSQYFSAAPVLGDTFIKDSVPISRVVAAGDEADKQQFLFDSIFEARKVRPMPVYGVPGFIDRF